MSSIQVVRIVNSGYCTMTCGCPDDSVPACPSLCRGSGGGLGICGHHQTLNVWLGEGHWAPGLQRVWDIRHSNSIDACAYCTPGKWE